MQSVPLELLRSTRMAKVVAWFCYLAAAPALGGTGMDPADIQWISEALSSSHRLRQGMENEAPGVAVSAASAAPTALAHVPESSQLLRFLPRPGRQRLRSLFEAVITRIKNVKQWLMNDPVSDTSADEGRSLQDAQLVFPCRPSRRPGEYGVIASIPPEEMLECVRIANEEIFKVNHQIVDLSFGKFGGLEVLMLSQRRGTSYYIEVVTQGDYAHYDVNRQPLKIFRDHSCLNRDQWCFVAQVKPIDSGFIVVDRHRVIHYNYTWLVEGNTAANEIPDVYVSHFGMMNSDEKALLDGQLEKDENGQLVDVDPNQKMKFPTAVAEYIPYNTTHICVECPAFRGVDTSMFEITPLIPHAWHRLLFVTDTGNHRVVILNASNIGQFDYVGQYGITGEARDNSTGFDWPWGIAVHSPAWEGRYEPAYANVFVVDRRNHRLVKLNLGYPLMPCENDVFDQTEPLQYNDQEKQWECRRFDRPRLYWSAEYGRGKDDFNRPSGLTDPTAVSLYLHYVVVAEVGGNAITMLRVNHQPPYDLILVTYFKPVNGINLQGSMAVSPFGYIWTTYTADDMKFYFGSMFLPEKLRESQPPSRYQDFLETCVNQSWHEALIDSPSDFVYYLGYVLNVSATNWIFPELPGFVDVFAFNKSGKFDIDLLNWVAYNGTMQFCEPPTTPTPPPFFGGNEDGWVIDGKSQSEFTKRSGALRSSQVGVALVTCCISALMLLVLPRP